MPKTYIFVRDGVEERVRLEKWVWGVVYDDDTELHQFDSDGKFHQFAEIDQSRVKMFVMYESEGNGRVDMPITDGAKIFHFYRNLMLDNATRRVRVYCFGWKTQGTTLYQYILPDGRMIASATDIDLSLFNI